ncbi:MAG: MFS transporter [Solirubrobacterales bacterium]
MRDSANTGSGVLSPGLVTLFALTTGVAAANLYYVQPLLDVIGGSFGVSDATAGLLVALVQLGYLSGLILLVPLGDLVERRGLISGLLGLAALAAAACAAAPAFWFLAAALVTLGVLSVVAQIIVPLSASLASEAERGRVVGTVMSGLLVGILSARVVSGLVAELVGWRGVFVLAALFLAALGVLLRAALPRIPVPAAQVRYGGALRSVLGLVRAEAVLRQRMAIALFVNVCFASMWTALTFLLSGSPYDYSEGLIGLFGLAGIAGALVAPFSGRLADRGRAGLAMTSFLALLVLSWGLLALGRDSVVPLLAGIVLLDLACQGSHINNQWTIYARRPEARSRVTTAYLASMFVGMVLGSVLAALVYDAGGWYAVSAVGAGAALMALGIWGLTRHLGETGTASVPADLAG